MGIERPEVIPNLPAARASRAPAPADHAARIRAERIKVLGEELYELCEAADTRTEDDRRHLLPLSGLTAAWLSGRFTDSTRTGYKRDIHTYFRWCHDLGINPAEARWHDFEMYALHLNDVEIDAGDEDEGRPRRLSPASRLRYLTSTSGFYRFAAARDEILRDPTRSLNRPALVELSRRVLTVAEQDRLWEAAQSYTWPKWGRPDPQRRLTMIACVAIGLDHAWRVGEYSTAQLSALMLIRDNAGDFPGVRRKMKGGRIQDDVFTDRARDAVSDMLAGRGLNPRAVWAQHHRGGIPAPGPLITFLWNKAPTSETMRVSLIELCVYAGIDPGSDTVNRTDRVTWHCIRRTSATTDLDNDVPQERVQQKLGHAKGDTTRLYDQHRGKVGRSPAMMRGLVTPWKAEP